MRRIAFFASSHKIGLTGQLTEQALAFCRAGEGQFLFLSGQNEQFPGLFKEFQRRGVSYSVIPELDDHNDFFQLVREFSRLMGRFNPDFVSVQTNWQLLIASCARYLTGADYKISYTINGYRHNYKWRAIVARSLITLMLSFFSDAVIAPCSFLKGRFSLLSKKMFVIPIGEDEMLFDEHPLPDFGGTRRLIFAGEFRTGKNQDILIYALKRYIDLSNDHEIELYLPGKGERLESCRLLARKLGLEKHVLFPGFLDRGRMLDLYLKCQFALVPSNVETFGHCIAEPFILGRVVMTRHVGVADDIIRHGETGFFFESADDLAKLMHSVLPDQELCGRVSRNAMESRDQFRWERICHRHFESIYNRAWAK